MQLYLIVYLILYYYKTTLFNIFTLIILVISLGIFPLPLISGLTLMLHDTLGIY